MQAPSLLQQYMNAQESIRTQYLTDLYLKSLCQNNLVNPSALLQRQIATNSLLQSQSRTNPFSNQSLPNSYESFLPRIQSSHNTGLSMLARLAERLNPLHMQMGRQVSVDMNQTMPVLCKTSERVGFYSKTEEGLKIEESETHLLDSQNSSENSKAREEIKDSTRSDSSDDETASKKVDKVSLSQKIAKLINTCGHDDRKHYAKGLCNKCYHKKSREKKPALCPHDSLYAKGLCQNCYGAKYRKNKRRSHKSRGRAIKY